MYIKEVFLPAVGQERPVLLVFDGHSTHVDLSVLERLAAQEITVLKLPAHSSHILQPLLLLDCSTMKPMKDKWDSEIVKWQRLHVGAKLPKQEFARLITMIGNDLNSVIIQTGFRKTGIYPVNRHVTNKEKFDSSSWSRWVKHNRKQNDKSIVDDTDRNGEENSEGSYTQKGLELDSAKENKVPTLTHACLKTKKNIKKKQLTMRYDYRKSIIILIQAVNQRGQRKRHRWNKEMMQKLLQTFLKE